MNLKRMLIVLAIGAVFVLSLLYLNSSQPETPLHPILDEAAAEMVETDLPPLAEAERTEIPYSEFEELSENGDILTMVITTRENGPAIVTARLRDGSIVWSEVAGDNILSEDLRNSIDENNVTYDREHVAASSWNFGTYLMIGAFVMIGFIVVPMIIRQMRGGGGAGPGGGAGNLPGLNTKIGEEVQTPTTRLADVGGINHIRPQIDDMVDKLLDTGEKGMLGGEVPKGFLLQGPPGTGKTLLARAIAGEVNARRTDGKQVGFLKASGSDFVQLYVGQGAKSVRDLFTAARKHAPCIVFIDEIDAVGKKRSDGSSPAGGNDEREQTLNALLTEMDGFDGDTGVIVIAATNRAELLDEALQRPGRFDRKVSVPLPDMTGREEILNIHAKNLQQRAQAARVRIQRRAGATLPQDAEQQQRLGPIKGLMAKRIAGAQARKGEDALPQIFENDVNFETLSRETAGCSGADLSEILKRAAEMAENRKATAISMADIRNAFQSLRMGDEMPRKLEFVDEFSTAVHEILGHGVLGAQSRMTLGRDHADDVQTLTIVPRGLSLGAVWSAPTKDRVSQSQKYLLGRLRTAMAGQIAEKLYLGPDAVTSGASSDIEYATNIANGMVSQFAMSGSTELTFRNYNERTGFGVTKAKADLVDNEVDALLKEQYIRAEAIMLSYAKAKDNDGNNLLEMLTRAMLVKKTLQGEEFMRLLKGEVVFDVAELGLGAQEAEFKALWTAQAKYRQDRTTAIKATHPDIAKEYKL